MLTYLFSGIAYGFAAAATPGPLSMYLLSHAASAGWRRTLPAAFSPLITDAPIALLAVTVLSRMPEALLLYLHLPGGVFVLYLACGAWKSWRRFDTHGASTAPHPNCLLKAATINWLNPNPYLAWSIFLGPALLAGWRQAPSLGIALLAGFYLTLIAVMMGLIAAAGTLAPRIRKSLIGLASVVLAGLGCYQMWLGGVALKQL